MSKSPAFQLYAADFYMDTAAWSATQVGAYFRLLMHEWVNGPLPNNMTKLARIAGLDPRNMQKCWSAELAKKFTTDDAGMLVNKRLEEVRKEQQEYSESQRVKGAHGAEKRWKKDMAGAIAQPQPEDSSSSSSSSSEKKRKKKKEGKCAEPFVPPEWVDAEAWTRFLEFRKKKGPFTEWAKHLIVVELDKLRKQGHDPTAVLNQSIVKGWTDVYPLKDKGGNGNGAYQRLDKFGKPAPRQKWEDEADRINADYYRGKAAQNAPDGKTGEDAG